MERGAWWSTVHRVAKSQMQPKRLSTHKIKSIYSLIRNVKLSSKVATTFCIPTRNVWEFLLLYNLTRFSGANVLDFGSSNRDAVVSHCCFNLHFIMTCTVDHLFIYYLHIFFSKVPFKIHGSFFKWAVCFLMLNNLFLINLKYKCGHHSFCHNML